MRLFLPGLVLLGLLCACGAGAPGRPALTGSLPADGDVLLAPLAEIVLEYDEPVTILNHGDARLRSGNVGIPLVPTLDPLDNTRVRLTPAEGWTLVPGVENVLTISQGLVINSDQQYSLDEYQITFETAPARPLHLGAPGRVVTLDPVSLAASLSLATPGGVDPRAIFSLELPGGPRTYVQLASGDGTGDALAWFEPGDLAMTPVSLTTSGGDLHAVAASMTAGARATFLYAAYRDPSAGLAGRVRLARIDSATGAESASILLDSVPSDAFTAPEALVYDPDRALLYVPCSDGATGTVAFVDEDTFTELDRDDLTAGTQGVTLPQGAGPAALARGHVRIADPFSSDLTSLNPADDTTRISTAAADFGVSVGLVRTADQRQLLQPLLGALTTPVIQRRNQTAYNDNGTYAVSDDVAGSSTGATGLRTLGATEREAAGARYLAILDSDVIAVWIDNGGSFTQRDMDSGIQGVQCLPLPALASGAYLVGTQLGLYQP